MSDNGIFPEQFIAAVQKFGDAAVVADCGNANPNKSGSTKYVNVQIKAKVGKDAWTLVKPIFKLNSVPVYGVQKFEKRKENSVQTRPSISIKKSTTGTRGVKGRDGTVTPYNERIGLALWYYHTICINKINEALKKNIIVWDDLTVRSKINYRDKDGIEIADPYIRMDLPIVKDDLGNPALDYNEIYDISKKMTKDECSMLSSDALPYHLGTVGDKALDFRNIEHYIKGGAKITGVIDVSAIVYSKQGISIPFKLLFLLVKQSTGRRVSPGATFSASELEFAEHDTVAAAEEYMDESPADPLGGDTSIPPPEMPAEGEEGEMDADKIAEIKAKMDALDVTSRRGDA